MTLLQASAHPDLPNEALQAVVMLTKAECEAVNVHCQAGPTSKSSVFNDFVVSSETLSAGAFLVVIEQVLAETKAAPLCYFQALAECSGPVLGVLTHQCQKFSSEAIVDPRPALCEAWFLTLSSLMDHTRSIAAPHECLAVRNTIIVETLCATTLLLLYPSLELDPSKRIHDLGMSMDGAQTLAVMDFFEKLFALSPEQLQLIARELQHRLQAELTNVTDDTLKGLAIIGALLFRASSGGLPPWFVEGIPVTFAAFFSGCGKCTRSFGQVIEGSMQVKLSNAGPAVGGAKPGSILAGRFFETMKESNRQDFIRRAVEIATNDTTESWRRFKALLKQASGGKKKATGCSRRPSPTSWDCARL